jgi:hypothetical protein
VLPNLRNTLIRSLNSFTLASLTKVNRALSVENQESLRITATGVSTEIYKLLFSIQYWKEAVSF